MTNQPQNHPFKLVMQSNNNLVLYDSLKNVLWSTNTESTSYTGCYLLMQDDGNLILFDSLGIVRWSTNTAQSQIFY